MPPASPSRKGSLTLVMRNVAAWALSTALAAGLVGLATDATLMSLGRAGWRGALGAGLTAAALGAFASAAAAPGLALMALVTARLGRLPSRLRPLALAPLFVTALAAGTLLTDALYRPHAGAYALIIVAFAVALTLLAQASRLAHPALSAFFLVAIGGTALGLDVVTPRVLYKELHDLCSLLSVAATLMALNGLRRRLARARPDVVLAGLVVLLAAASLETLTVDRWAPGWRALAWQLARYEPRMSRACRALVDFDGDGFSPVAWGGDCDDFNPARNPAQHESGHGKDANCNGIVPPAHPSEAERGLAPPVGDPDLLPDSVDLVLLVTFDCFRRDGFRPDLMPRLTELAARGITFTRLYTGGSRTKISLPLMMRGSDEGTPLPVRLERAGVKATVMFGYEDPVLNRQVLAGYHDLVLPGHVRWTARETTNLALGRLHAGALHRQFLWLHYFDAHYPLTLPGDFSPRPVPPGMPATFGVYQSELAYEDRELGRLVDGLAEDGRLERTLIIVSADHGEGFGQHEVPLHGISAYEMLVHVAGVMVGPGVPAMRYDGLVSHRDFPATVLGAFGLVRAQPDVEEYGRSWLRLRLAPAAKLHRFVVTRSARAASGDDYSLPMAAIIEDHYKLIETFEDRLTELYDPVADPLEEHNLATSDPLHTGKLDDHLQMFRDVDGFP